METNKRLILSSTVNGNINLISKNLSYKPGDKLLYISTASEPETGFKGWVDEDAEAFQKLGFEITRFSLTDRTKEEVRKIVHEHDVVFVGGGNPFYLLAKVRETDFEEAIREHINKGKQYIGVSSGALIAGPDLEPAKREDALAKAPALSSYKGMSLVDFIMFPHWGSTLSRELYLHHRMELAYSDKNKIILLTDNQILVVKGDWYQILSR